VLGESAFSTLLAGSRRTCIKATSRGSQLVAATPRPGPFPGTIWRRADQRPDGYAALTTVIGGGQTLLLTDRHGWAVLARAGTHGPTKYQYWKTTP